ncbi:MAG: family transposase [Clostridia bacterium]|jgi:hypothetical protein|nr:family transposase [Clostridia bacterium]
MTFIPFLDKLAEKLLKRHESEENYIYLDGNKQKSYIILQAYEVMKSKKFKNKIEKRENMGVTFYKEIGS